MDNIEQVKEIEAALVGAVLRDGRTYERVREMVKPESFGVHAYGFAWKACENLHEQGLSIDTFTVGDELERMGKMADFVDGQWSGRALLSDLRSNGDPRNVTDYAANVQDYHIKRELEQVFTQGVMQSKNGRRAKDIIADVSRRLIEYEPHNEADEFTVPIAVAMSEGYDMTDAASRGELIGVKTGYMDLDKVLSGGMYKDNVYLVAARPGQGKTALLLSIVLNAARDGKRIAIFSLEMSRAQVAQRLAAQVAEVDLSRIIEGKMNTEEWQKYNDAIEKVEKLPIIINDLSSIKISNIRQTGRRIKQKYGLDLVILDYVQLADPDDTKKQNREQEVSQVSRGLKKMARELEVPILAAAQLSRSVEQRADKKPILSDLRESGSLEQDSYAVMFIYRPDQYEKDTQKANIAEVIVAKHRNGPVGSIELVWRPVITRFESATTRIFRLNE